MFFPYQIVLSFSNLLFKQGTISNMIIPFIMLLPTSSHLPSKDFDFCFYNMASRYFFNPSRYFFVSVKYCCRSSSVQSFQILFSISWSGVIFSDEKIFPFSVRRRIVFLPFPCSKYTISSFSSLRMAELMVWRLIPVSLLISLCRHCPSFSQRTYKIF